MKLQRRVGVIMPISAIDGCAAEHWEDVLGILNQVIEASGFTPSLVSDAQEVGIIQKRIVQNLYNNDMMVCDVSGKNPNVMFELGMRLAFDKPVIIIKDDKTNYNFDTSPVEHIDYPRDLRFTKVIDFKDKLSAKLKATFQKHKEEPQSISYLKSFGDIQVAKMGKKEVTAEAFIMDALKDLRMEMEMTRRDMARLRSPRYFPSARSTDGDSVLVDLILECFAVNNVDPRNADSEAISKIAGILEGNPAIRKLGHSRERMFSVIAEVVGKIGKRP